MGIGGINAVNAGDVFDAGANCVAVCTAIIASDEPGKVSRSILDARQRSTRPVV
ncbi:MAG: hypothetical protein R3E58_05020 [Phycisphaerae bacterium]